MAYPYDCQVCGEEDGRAEGHLGCKFNGCVYYVDELEKSIKIMKDNLSDWKALIPLRAQIAKIEELGKSMGRPLYTRGPNWPS